MTVIPETFQTKIFFIDENEQSLYDRNQMFLFSEDEDKRVSSLLSRLANYDDAIITTKYFTSPSHALDWVREIGGETVGKMNNEK